MVAECIELYFCRTNSEIDRTFFLCTSFQPIMTDIFLTKVLKAHQDCDQCPKSEEIAGFFNRLLGLLFPTFSSEVIKDKQALKDGLSALRSELENFLLRQKHPNASEASSHFFDQVLPSVYDLIIMDVEAIYAGDPAATSTEEIKRSYPGFYAIASYRVAHGLLKLGVNNLPRSITENAHSRTGIDIHPGAQIGKRFCIDHGTGIVIGETAIIGNDVKVYQGVTLGGLSIDKNMADTKRHPTIEDEVIIYSGATILGGSTVIGKGSVIGGNVWLTKSVPAGSKVYYKTQLVTDGQDSGTEMVVIKEATA